jgi:hypothetical protein
LKKLASIDARVCWRERVFSAATPEIDTLTPAGKTARAIAVAANLSVDENARSQTGKTK